MRKKTDVQIYSAPAGENIRNTARNMAKQAKKKKKPVFAEFNGIVLRAESKGAMVDIALAVLQSFKIQEAIRARVYDIANAMITLANKTGTEVIVRMDGVTLVAEPGSDADQILKPYLQKSPLLMRMPKPTRAK